jgi:hypothetical protein
VERRRQQAAGGAVFQPVEHMAQDAKARLAPRRWLSPEWMPSVRISTFSTPLTMPRRLVVSHSWS